MFEVFTIMRQLHELLWYLTEALTLQPARPLHDELSRALDETERLTHNGPDALMDLDVAAHRRGVNALLRRSSELVRGDVRRTKKDRSGADLIGSDLRGADLRGADLRGVADLLGADFRGADLGGTDLTGSIFLTQSQLDAAKGDSDTALPPSLTRPAHWERRESTGPHPGQQPPRST